MKLDKIATVFGAAGFAFVLMLLPATTAIGQEAQAASKPEPIVYKQTTNSKGEPVELKMHVFKPEGWEATDKRPAIVFFFGGGWVSGRPAQFYPHCKDLAKLGMVAISAEYRIKSKHGTPPQACVEDGKSAVRYIRGHAKQLGVDPDRIVSAGGSAGGHVAACTGVLRNPEHEAPNESRSLISSTPNLMVLYNPVIDTGLKGYGSKKLGDQAIAYSPLHQAHKDQPPSIIFHGDADTVVRIDSVRAFEKKSKELGADCTLVEYEGAGHSFFNHTSFKRRKAGTPDYYKLIGDETVAFLKKHGYVNN